MFAILYIIIFDQMCILLLLVMLTTCKGSVVVCGACGHKIASTEDAVVVESSAAIATAYVEENSSTMYRQVFQNPHGVVFELSTYVDAALQCENAVHYDDSFFRNYTWSVCACPRCGAHQGWLFQSTLPSLHPGSFYGIPTRNTRMTGAHSTTPTYTYEL